MKLCLCHRLALILPVLASLPHDTLTAQTPAPVPAPAAAETPASAPAAPPLAPAPVAPDTGSDPAQKMLRVRLAGQMQRAGLLAAEIHNADLRIESRFDDLLATMRTVSDSKNSHTKVTRMKEETIASLQQAMTYYQEKRAWLQEQMVRPTFNLTQTQKQTISNEFEERIEKRVKQIVDLYKTFPTHQDFQRYKAVGHNFFGGTRYVDSEDYRENLRLTSQTHTMRYRLIKDLQSTADRLDQENSMLAGLSGNTQNNELREVYGDEQRKNEELSRVLRQDLEAIYKGPDVPGRPIGGEEAQALDKVIKHSIDALHSEFTLLFSRYADWLTAASAVNTLRAQLEKP
jgi:vacuolar-type H+-ATPase subunit I/STV1